MASLISEPMVKCWLETSSSTRNSKASNTNRACKLHTRSSTCTRRSSSCSLHSKITKCTRDLCLKMKRRSTLHLRGCSNKWTNRIQAKQVASRQSKVSSSTSHSKLPLAHQVCPVAIQNRSRKTGLLTCPYYQWATTGTARRVSRDNTLTKQFTST